MCWHPLDTQILEITTAAFSVASAVIVPWSVWIVRGLGYTVGVYPRETCNFHPLPFSLYKKE